MKWMIKGDDVINDYKEGELFLQQKATRYVVNVFFVPFVLQACGGHPADGIQMEVSVTSGLVPEVKYQWCVT